MAANLTTLEILFTWYIIVSVKPVCLCVSSQSVRWISFFILVDVCCWIHFLFGFLYGELNDYWLVLVKKKCRLLMMSERGVDCWVEVKIYFN